MSQPFVPLLLHMAAPLTVTPPIPDRTPDPPPTPVDLEALRSKAYEDGFLAAKREATREIDALRAQIGTIGAIVEEIAKLRKDSLHRAATDVADLVTSLSQKVIGDALTVHPDAMAHLVLKAIERLPDEEEIWIRVPLLSVDSVIAQLPERYRPRVVADPTLERGCVVETRHASVDASLETAFQGISEATAHWLASRS